MSFLFTYFYAIAKIPSLHNLLLTGSFFSLAMAAIQISLSLVFFSKMATVVNKGRQMRSMGSQRKLVDTAMIIDIHMRLMTTTIRITETIILRAYSSQKIVKPVAMKIPALKQSLNRVLSRTVGCFCKVSSYSPACLRMKSGSHLFELVFSVLY